MNPDNSNLKLNYLKEKFLDGSRLNYLFSDPAKENEDELINFVEKIAPLREKISNVQSIENLKFVMQEIEPIMQDAWNKVWNQTGLSHDAIANYYLTSGVDSSQEWINKQTEIYDNKKFTGFFEKTSDALKDIFGFEFKAKKEELLSSETVELGKKIINKFNLSHIDLSSYSSNKECLKFLNKFDTNASLAFEKLGVLPEVLGINKSFSISSNTTGQAFCCSVPKKISLDIAHMSASTILHEWVHGLDNYVCENATSINSYVSSREDVFFEDEKFPITQAYKEIRNLTQSLFNDNPEIINTVKDKIIKDNSAKFYSIILGNDWYTMPEEKRNSLLSEKAINKVNNFMSMNLNSQGYEYVAKDLVANIKSLGVDINETTLADKRSEIETDIKPYFESVNKNFIHGKSLYYIGCLISNKVLAVPVVFIESKIADVKNFLGVEDKKTKTAFDKNYFSNPLEMLARYFESQVFPEAAKISNLLQMVPAYKITKDENFEVNKDKILSHVFGKNKILKNISQMRAVENTTDNKMKV